MYKKCRHIHFIGIGGIGMSGIAEVLQLQGYKVSGCDECQNSKILSHLKDIGCQIHTTHNKDHIENADVLVYSSAIKKDHPEVVAALKKGIPVIPRAIMLAELMRMKYGIAVSGTHGKTTVTSIISHILIEAGLDPTIVIGGVLKNISANAKLGAGNYLIAEADESDRSLLYLNPSIAVVTNIDADHLDRYKNLTDIKQTFKNFLARLPFYGKAILCIDDKNIRSILPLPHIRAIKYGFSKTANLIGKIVEIKESTSIFDVFINTQSTFFREICENTNGSNLCKNRSKKILKLGRITLNMPGRHNILNSLASIALSLEFDVPFEKIKTSLKNFKGIERRFEFKGNYKGSEIFDDYGHHPTEIKSTLKVAQLRAKKDLHIIFQPHRFSRTKKLWKDFVETFAKNKKIKNLYLAEIYPASEAPIPGITSEKLAKAIRAKNPNINVFNFSTYEEIEKNVKEVLNSGDLLLTVGAGKINVIGEKLSAKK